MNAGPAGGDNPTGTVLNGDLEPLFGQDDLPAGFAEGRRSDRRRAVELLQTPGGESR